MYLGDEDLAKVTCVLVLHRKRQTSMGTGSATDTPAGKPSRSEQCTQANLQQRPNAIYMCAVAVSGPGS